MFLNSRIYGFYAFAGDSKRLTTSCNAEDEDDK